MRHILLILTFFLLLSHHLCAQVEIESKRIVFHVPFKTFFESNPSVKEIKFWINPKDDSVRIGIIEQSLPEYTHYNRFNLNQIGDRYLLQKRFGTFSFPRAIYNRFIDPMAYSRFIHGSIRHDSVFISITQIYFTKKQTVERNLFEKIRIEGGYKKGTLVLGQEMSDYFQSKKNDDMPEDSIVLLFGMINKKTMKVDTILAGESRFALSMIEFINASGPWFPMEAGGRPVKAYKRIYARLKSDNTFDLEVY